MTMMQTKRRKAGINTLAFGAGSAVLYAAVYAYADPITAYIAKGGAAGLVSVAAVFLFSWVHGSFASNLWTTLGIEAGRKGQRKTAEKTVRAPSQAARPRATLNV